MPGGCIEAWLNLKEPLFEGRDAIMGGQISQVVDMRQAYTVSVNPAFPVVMKSNVNLDSRIAERSPAPSIVLNAEKAD